MFIALYSSARTHLVVMSECSVFVSGTHRAFLVVIQSDPGGRSRPARDSGRVVLRFEGHGRRPCDVSRAPGTGPWGGGAPLVPEAIRADRASRPRSWTPSRRQVAPEWSCPHALGNRYTSERPQPVYPFREAVAPSVPEPSFGGAASVSERMSMRQPVSFAASLAFWPSLPIASESWKSGTTTRADRVAGSTSVTLLTCDGDSACATNSAGSSL